MFKEAEDEQYIQDLVLELKNISSTSVFISCSAGAGFLVNQGCGTGGPDESSQAKYF